MANDPEITIRPCIVDDSRPVLELWKATGVKGSLPDSVEAVVARLERDPDLFVVAEVNGRLVGTLIGGWDGWRGSMYRLAVHPGHRRRGIARALVREVEKRLREKGARRITALVLDAEEEAQSFWSALGYGHDQEIRRYVRNV